MVSIRAASRASLVVLVAALGLVAIPAAHATIATPPAPAPVLTAAATAELGGLAPTDTWAGLVSFERGTTTGAISAAALANGLTVARDYPAVAGAYLVGPVAGFRTLAAAPSVVRIDANRILAFHDETAGWATRTKIVHEAVAGGPYYDASGNVLDGSGVGVAIVDSGVNAAHPDLTDRVARNFKIVCPSPGLVNTQTGQCYAGAQYEELPPGVTGDTSSGHGTHVAGIVSGTGAASTGDYAGGPAPADEGTFTGVAPGATLYGFSTGEAISVLFALEAWQWIYDHNDELSPRIRVANQSFGETGGATYDPETVDARMVDALVKDRGITMVFSAGNEGGDGTTDSTSSYCDDPTPGVICVANYSDTTPSTDPTGTGTRDNALSDDSSRGLTSDQTTWPDISAPGTFITSPCIRAVQPVCATGIVDEVRWDSLYGTISGTSMASPHVAGIAALLLQAKPALTPGAVEDALADTAYKFTAGGAYVADAQNTGGSTSFDKGAGLADATAALDALGVAHGSIPLPLTNVPLATDHTGETPIPAADITGVSVTQLADAVRFDVTVVDAANLGGASSARLRLYATVKGVPYQQDVNITPATVNGNTVSITVPLTDIGSPSPTDPVYGLNVYSYAGTGVVALQDVAVGGDPGVVQANVHEMFLRPFSLGVEPPPVTTTTTTSTTTTTIGSTKGNGRGKPKNH